MSRNARLGLVVGPVAVLVIAWVVTASADGLQGVTAEVRPPDMMPLCVGVEPAVRISGPAQVIPQPGCYTVLGEVSREAVVPLDSLSVGVKVPSGASYAVYFDHSDQSLVEVELPDPLTLAAHQAIARAPDWLQEELADNLGKLEAADQDTFAQLILNADDPYVDEIAFQVARVATVSLTHTLFTPDLIVENAQLIYEHDEALQYVDVVDYGTAGGGGDYYSTTRYRVVDGGDTTWAEIPREMYYWYVVHPKISDETVKKSAEQDPRQSTYGYFWRHYLYSNPDSVYDYSDSAGTPGVYPILGEVLTLPTVFWDGQQHDVPYGRPFDVDDLALDIVGNWVTRLVPNAASGNRPIQPNQIIYEHNGNCGELQDALCAAARTALIPSVCVSDHCEDHVWNEFFWAAPDDDWHPYQTDLGGGGTHIDNPGIAYDRDHGGSKDISGVWAWRGDGYIYETVARYSCFSTLVVHVEDANAKPVDGALVLLWSEAWGGGGLTACVWAYTDSRGFCTLELGDRQDYYLHVDGVVGDYPGTDLDDVVQIIDDSAPGQTYYKSVTLSGAVPRPEYEVDDTQGDTYHVSITFDAAHEIIYGNNLYGDDPDFAKWEQPGAADFFLCDAANYGLFAGGTAFTAAVGAEDVSSGDIAFSLPDTTTDWYLVLSNGDHVVNKQGIEAEITVYYGVTDAPDPPLAESRFELCQNAPNPLESATAIRYTVPASGTSHTRSHVSLRIYDPAGRRVKTLVQGIRGPGSYRAVWDGSTDAGVPVASGVYLYRLEVRPHSGTELLAGTKALILSR